MRRVFADSLLWIAIASPRDQWHTPAVEAGRTLQGARIITTEEVLTEFLNALRHHPDLRRAATRMVKGIQGDPDITILQQSRQSFFAGLALDEKGL